VKNYSEKLNARKAKYNGEDKKEFLELGKQAKVVSFEAMNKMRCPDEKARIYVVQAFNTNYENWNTVADDIRFKDTNGANHAVRSQTTSIREAGNFKHLTNDGTRGISQTTKLQNI
jgi:hypothetical protein